MPDPVAPEARTRDLIHEVEAIIAVAQRKPATIQHDATLPTIPASPGTRDQVADMVAYAKRVYAARRARERHIPAELLGEPGYDILLDAFISRAENRKVSVTSLCVAATAKPTTALRWISMLEQRGLLAREASASDRRRRYLALSEAGNALVSVALAAERDVWRASS